MIDIKHLTTYLEILISSNSIANMLVSKNFGPHQERAPVQNATHVNPNVDRTNDLFENKCFKSSQ